MRISHSTREQLSALGSRGAPGPCAGVDLPIEEVLRYREHPARWVQVINHFERVLQFFAEEVRHGNYPLALRCLGICDGLLPAEDLKGLGDGDDLLLETEIAGGQSKHFAFSESTPVQDLEYIEGQRVIHHGFGEEDVLLSGPELHFNVVLTAHIPDLTGRVAGKTIELHRVVEDSAELVVDGLEIGLAEGLLGLRVPIGQQFILPFHDLRVLDILHTQITKTRNNVFLDDAGLCDESAALDPGRNILQIERVFSFFSLSSLGLIHKFWIGRQKNISSLVFHCDRAPCLGEKVSYFCRTRRSTINEQKKKKP